MLTDDLKKLTDNSGGGWQGSFMPIQNKKWRRIALAILIIVPVIAIGWYFAKDHTPVPDASTYRGKTFTFTYPRQGVLKEYASGVVSIGNEKGDEYAPLVEVVRYMNDPDQPTPSSFEAFAKQQALYLCGSDATEQVACSKPVAEPYATSRGYKGLKISLTLTRTNLSTGTSTAATYAPIYVVNTTAKPDPGEKLRYSGIFIYHALPAVLSGSVSQTLLDEVIGTLKVPSLEPKPQPAPAATTTASTTAS